MNKLNDKIDFLSKSENNTENPTYINGIAQIHFNAWSYLDDNLWAGLINSIFEKLNEYLTETTKSGVAKIKVREKLTEKLISFKSALISLTEKQSGLELIQDAYKNEKTQLEKNIQYSFTNQILDSIGDNSELKDLHDKLTNYDSSFIEIISIKNSKIVQEFTFWNNFFTNLKIIKDFRKYLIYGILIVAISFGINYLISLLSINWMIIVSPIILALSKLGINLTTVCKKYASIKSYVKKLNTFIETNKEKKDEISRIEKSINIAKNQIIEADAQIEALKTKIVSYEYKLKHDLTEDTISNFITDRATHKDYKNQLGIISVIRKDFETLSELFVENKSNNTINNEKEFEEQEKFSDRQIIKDQFKEGKKLQRIVLYIDDLDRCPEDKVIEVLEAVNLIMAFPLFIVVVGVDSSWVKNALIKKYHLQFGETKGTDYKKREASDYLEKIFQVPFHLKQAEDDGVKNMIDKLVKVEEDKTTTKHENKTTNSQPNNKEHETPVTEEKEMINDSSETINADSEEIQTDEIKHKERHLALTKQELDLMKDMSGIIGNNPRAIKRFVNVYNIVRAHAGLGLIRENKKEDYLTLMFLLALPMGAYKELYKDFVSDINKIYHYKEEENLSKYFSGSFNNENEHKENKNTRLGNYIDEMKLRGLFEKISLFHLKEQNGFIQRFTFTDIID